MTRKKTFFCIGILNKLVLFHFVQFYRTLQGVAAVMTWKLWKIVVLWHFFDIPHFRTIELWFSGKQCSKKVRAFTRVTNLGDNELFQSVWVLWAHIWSERILKIKTYGVMLKNWLCRNSSFRTLFQVELDFFMCERTPHGCTNRFQFPRDYCTLFVNVCFPLFLLVFKEVRVVLSFPPTHDHVISIDCKIKTEK